MRATTLLRGLSHLLNICVASPSHSHSALFHILGVFQFSCYVHHEKSKCRRGTAREEKCMEMYDESIQRAFVPKLTTNPIER
jgi:hypothetical protein